MAADAKAADSMALPTVVLTTRPAMVAASVRSNGQVVPGISRRAEG